MIKVFMANDSQQKVGGGFTFLHNLQEALSGKVVFTDKITECDIYFVSGVSMVEKGHIKMAKELGKKIIVRVDGVPANSRNRGCGTSRLFSYCQIADEVIYQSQWSKDLIMPFVKKDGPIILNGVNTDIFRPDDRRIDKQGSPQFLYIRFGRGENKRWEYAWYLFQQEYFKNPKAHLWIVGKFGPGTVEYKFDLFGGAENSYKFWNVITDRLELAKIYRGADILLCPYVNDSCSNVINEALASGLAIQGSGLDSGGIKEQLVAGVISLEEMGDRYLEVFNKLV